MGPVLLQLWAVLLGAATGTLEPAADSRAAATGCSRRPAGSRSGNKGAARRGHCSHPLPSPAHPGAPWRAPAPRCGPGQDFPLRSFGKLAQLPVTLGGGAGKGVTLGGARQCSELRHCLFPLRTARATGKSCRGSRALPPVPGSRLRRARAGLKSPRGAPGQPVSPRPSLQPRVACGLPEGSGLGSGGQPALAGTRRHPERCSRRR